MYPAKGFVDHVSPSLGVLGQAKYVSARENHPREKGDTIREQPRPGNEVDAVKRPLLQVAISRKLKCSPD